MLEVFIAGGIMEQCFCRGTPTLRIAVDQQIPDRLCPRGSAWFTGLNDVKPARFQEGAQALDLCCLGADRKV